MTALLILAALGLIGFGALVGGMIRTGNPSTERPIRVIRRTAVVIPLRRGSFFDEVA
jgi:hypothetical protein